MDEADSDELVLIQGIIDAWFEDEDGAVLVDYKTDRIREGEETVLLDRYRLQLIYYRRALEQITGKTVRQAFLYSLALQKEIPDVLKIPGSQDAGRAIPPPRRSAPLHREGIRSSGQKDCHSSSLWAFLA